MKGSPAEKRAEFHHCSVPSSSFCTPVRCVEIRNYSRPDAFLWARPGFRGSQTDSGFSLFAFAQAALTIALPPAPAWSLALVQPRVCPVFMSKKSKKKAEKLARKAAKMASKVSAKSSKRKGSAKSQVLTNPTVRPPRRLKAGMFVYVFGKNKGRRQRLDEGAARRQGRQPRRDDPHRPARASRVSPSRPRSAPTITTTSRPIRSRCEAQVEAGVANMEKIMGTKFGDTKAMPLLVAVRSGARDSMPGMMDTILNLGLNDQTVLALAKATGNERFAWDCYRRFIQMYGDVVMGVQKLPDRGSRSVRDRHRHTSRTSATASTRSRTPSSPPTTSRNWSSASRRW